MAIDENDLAQWARDRASAIEAQPRNGALQTKAILDEVSIVLSAAVPGTELLSVRSSRVVERDDYRDRLLAQRRAGRITKAQYTDAVQLDLDAEEILDKLGIY